MYALSDSSIRPLREVNKSYPPSSRSLPSQLHKRPLIDCQIK